MGLTIIQLLDKYILSFVFIMENIFNNICYVTVQEKKLISSKYRMQKLYPPMLTPKYHKMNTCSKGAQETGRISDQVLKPLRA